MRFGLIALAAMASFSVGAAYAQDTTTATTETAAASELAAPPAAAEPAPPAEAAAEPAPAAEAAPPPPEAPPAAALPGGLSAPAEGKGQVVFFRPSRFVGAALSFTVRENETALGRLPNGRYFVHAAESGIHEYEIGRNDTMRMEIEPGETYYVIQNTQMGIIAGRAVLAPSDAATFEAALEDMRVSDPIEE